MAKGYPNDWGSRRRQVYKRDNYTCQSCGKRGGRWGGAELHAHHIVPKSKGGSHKLRNLKTLCKECHAQAHSKTGATTHRPEHGSWGWMHRQVDQEKNERFDGCPSCGERSLKVRWERLKFLKKAKVVQCSECGAMFDERIKETDGERYLELVRVRSVKEIEPARSAASQELERMTVRNEMDERRARQEAMHTFGGCPNCGEAKNIIVKTPFYALTKRIVCTNCGAKFKRKLFSKSKWKMTSGDSDLLGETRNAQEWEQIAIDCGDESDEEPRDNPTENEPSDPSAKPPEHIEGAAASDEAQGDEPTQEAISDPPANPTEHLHHIPAGTWRGNVARVLKTEEWMDARDVSEAVTNSKAISKSLSSSGASSVLSDMMRHDDVKRRKVSKGKTQYEYRLREDAVVD